MSIITVRTVKTVKTTAIIATLALVIVGVAYLVSRRSDKPAPLSRTIEAAEIKAEQAALVAVEAENKAVEARPKVQAARAKVVSLARNDAKHTLHQPGTLAMPYPRAGTLAMPYPATDNNSLIVSHNVNIDALFDSLPEAKKEIANLLELVSALDEQLVLETERGDAWKAAFEAERELTEALKAEVKSARRSARVAGAVGGALLLLLALL